MSGQEQKTNIKPDNTVVWIVITKLISILVKKNN